MKVEINVTDEDIENGQPGDCQLCPIALAIRPLLRSDLQPKVRSNGIAFHGADHRGLSIPLPSEAKDFICDFDDEDCSISPITFNLDIPDQYLKEAHNANPNI
jgi:hypothetical protein